MFNMFRNITPVNGFDEYNSSNARQNNYAWSMTEMHDYLYVGTGRNIFYSVAKRLPRCTELISDFLKNLSRIILI